MCGNYSTDNLDQPPTSTMHGTSSSPLALTKKTHRKESLSSTCGTLNSSNHSAVVLEDGAVLTDSDKPLVRQLRHSGTKFDTEITHRALKLHDRTLLEVITKRASAKQNPSSSRRLEDRFASHMNFHQTEKQLAQLRSDRLAHKALVVEEDEDDALDKSLAKFWEREQRKSVYNVTSNLHHLVLIGEEDNIVTYAGYQFSQAMPQNNYAVSSHTMNSCSA